MQDIESGEKLAMLQCFIFPVGSSSEGFPKEGDINCVGGQSCVGDRRLVVVAFAIIIKLEVEILSNQPMIRY